MTYYQFIHEVEVRVKEEMKDGVMVYIRSAVKNNGTKRHGLTIAKKGINIYPTIYLEEYYQQFQRGSSVESIAGEILRLYKEIRFQRSFEWEFFKDYREVRRRIVYRLVNREANKELLEEVPYEEYLDLAVVFYVMFEVNSHGMASMMVRDEHLKMWGVSKEEILSEAHENTERLLPYEFRTMFALLEELTGEVGSGCEDIMYVMSNRARSYGAATILYEERLDGIGDYLKENYYVLPSSVHEVIIVPESAASGHEAMNALVAEVNETQIEAEEILSDHAYYYDRRKRELYL